MEGTKGTAATRAKNKYAAANYERLSPFVKKGKKQRYKDAAAAGGYSSLNEFLETAMDRLADEILGKEQRHHTRRCRGRPRAPRRNNHFFFVQTITTGFYLIPC